MSDERDDEILGRALSRAIETQEAHETPYERSRLAEQSSRRGFPFWQLAGIAAMLVVAVALGSWFTRSTAPGPIASQPSPSEPTTTAPATLPTSPSPQPSLVDRPYIYIMDPRTELPHATVATGGVILPAPSDAPGRIAWRLKKLGERFPESGVPATAIVRSVSVSGDLATVDYDTAWTTRDIWKGFSSAETVRAVQEIVYTATEEPGIRRALIRENGGTAKIGNGLIDKPLAREDVLGYPIAAKVGFTNGISDAGRSDAAAASARIESSVDVISPGLARVTVRTLGADGKPAKLPRWAVWLDAADPASTGKYVLRVQLRAATALFASASVQHVDRTPLRMIAATADTIELALDDARPWRAWVDQDETALTVDIGGMPRAVSDRIAVYAPVALLDMSRTFNVSGASRTFEANVLWRVKDSSHKVVARGFTTATRGTSYVWGTFEVRVTLPATVSGAVTLEVFEASPKDGSDEGLVAIPLIVR